ncbi:serine/threonine-protein phosphatase 4 regulatory subunit 4 isoform X2 [Aethina tumida]|uniref:serine/threonine-protein phosphatase 4 regulatory subunit 4 isoform X2 n=1 Tax=Aethina tumida TaxID=116153 RepID=UPI00096AF367|nr:serine/threonine-protein phosphatase 4 regulatory subunit 4 isoform X2 [Aethina tumida]
MNEKEKIYLEEGCRNLQEPLFHIGDNEMILRGDDLQKISVIESLPKLMTNTVLSPLVIQKVLPKLQQELPNASCEVHIVASKVFVQLVELNQQPSKNLLIIILQGIDNKDPVISGSWMDTLIAALPNLPSDMLKTSVLPMALMKSDIHKPMMFRIASCKILGQLCAHPGLTHGDIKKDILPHVQSLCQDCQFEVRANMCAQLPIIAKGLSGESVVTSALLPNLVELCNDENMMVRIAGIDAISSFLTYIQDSHTSHTILHLFKQLCSRGYDEGNTTYAALSKNMGKILQNLDKHLTSTDCVWFLNVYKSLCRRGIRNNLELDASLGMICREHCALNLPIMTDLIVRHSPSNLNSIYTAIENLTGDSCFLIRKNVALNLVNVIKILGPECKNVKGELVKLLRDETEDVLGALIPSLAEILMHFEAYNILSREAVTMLCFDLYRALVKCHLELFSGHIWRMQEQYLAQLECLPFCLPSDFIYQHFVPFILNDSIDGRARPVRIQATRTLLVFLRYNLKEPQRKWIRESMFNKLCCSRSAYTRIIYVKMCDNVLDLFSGRYFKEYFYTHLMTLLEDPVLNIRYAVVSMATRLREICNPLDKTLKPNLETALNKLATYETNKDVLCLLKQKLKEVKTAVPPKKDFFLEEKRRVEEEDRVFAGKTVLIPPQNKFFLDIVVTPPPQNTSSNQTPTNPGIQNKLQTDVFTRDFYVDAGIDLSEYHLKQRQSPTVSIKNIGGDLSEVDLKKLEIASNLTDDAKANIKKITMGKTSHKPEIKRRYSSINLYENRQSLNVLRRRSLNIVGTELSKIPVSKRCNSQKDLKDNPSTTVAATSGGQVVKDLKENNLPSNHTRLKGCNIKKISHLPVLKSGTTSKKVMNPEAKN